MDLVHIIPSEPKRVQRADKVERVQVNTHSAVKRLVRIDLKPAVVLNVAETVITQSVVLKQNEAQVERLKRKERKADVLSEKPAQRVLL